MGVIASQITNLTIAYSIFYSDAAKKTSKLRVIGLCTGNSPGPVNSPHKCLVTVTGELPSQRPVRWSFDVFFDLRLNKQLSKQSWGRWFETPPRSLWRHCNGMMGKQHRPGYSVTYFPVMRVTCLAEHFWAPPEMMLYWGLLMKTSAS